MNGSTLQFVTYDTGRIDSGFGIGLEVGGVVDVQGVSRGTFSGVRIGLEWRRLYSRLTVGPSIGTGGVGRTATCILGCFTLISGHGCQRPYHVENTGSRPILYLFAFLGGTVVEHTFSQTTTIENVFYCVQSIVA